MASSISNYAKRMGRLSSRIFGEVARQTPRPAFKVVKLFSEKPINKKPSFYDYYPRHVELTQLMNKLRFYGLFRNEHQDFQDEMKRLRKLRGKVKTKKGEGKGADKRLQKARERQEKMKKRNIKVMYMKKLDNSPMALAAKTQQKKVINAKKKKKKKSE